MKSTALKFKEQHKQHIRAKRNMVSDTQNYNKNEILSKEDRMRQYTDNNRKKQQLEALARIELDA